jgi:hypothetical protein
MKKKKKSVSNIDLLNQQINIFNDLKILIINIIHFIKILILGLILKKNYY